MGSIYTINLIEIEHAKTIAGIETHKIKTIAGEEGGGGGDAFVAACQSTGNLFGLWTCQEVNTGDLADGATIMTEIGGNDKPNLIAELASTGNWQIEDSSAPGGHSTALTKYVSTDAGDCNTTNYGAAQDSWTAPVGCCDPVEPCAGFVIFYQPSVHSRIEIVSYFGTATTPQGTANVLGLATYNKINGVTFGATGTNFALSHGNSSDDRTNNWWFFAWRLYDSDANGSADRFEAFVQQIGSNWGTNQSTWDMAPSCDPCPAPLTGLRFGYNTTGTPPADIRWAAHAIFSDDVDEDTFEGIFEAAGLGA